MYLTDCRDLARSTAGGVGGLLVRILRGARGIRRRDKKFIWIGFDQYYPHAPVDSYKNALWASGLEYFRGRGSSYSNIIQKRVRNYSAGFS